MVMTTRYEAHSIEAMFEPGSRNRVLRNKLGIKRVREMDLAESQALLLAQQRALEHFSEIHRFTAKDIRDLHRMWLGPIYEWAGSYRSLNIGKGGFQFAHAPLIPRLMAEFEYGPLAKLTPCRPATHPKTAYALAVVHAELVLIHPFRDGNGRLARLLSLLMGLQADLPPLDFTPMDGRNKRKYFAAVHAAMSRNYQPMTTLFEKIIEVTWRRAASSGL